MTREAAVLNLPVSRRLRSSVLAKPLACARGGILLHYDDSSRDDWALDWFVHPDCTNGYTWIALDDGELVELVAPAHRTPHAGACRTPNANSFYYGLAATTNGKTPVTPKQLSTIVDVCVEVFRHHRWSPDSVDIRIEGHDRQAIWTPSTTRAAGLPDTKGKALWGKLGRKCDPTGLHPKKYGVILDVAAVRDLTRARLTSVTSPS